MVNFTTSLYILNTNQDSLNFFHISFKVYKTVVQIRIKLLWSQQQIEVGTSIRYKKTTTFNMKTTLLLVRIFDIEFSTLMTFIQTELHFTPLQLFISINNTHYFDQKFLFFIKMLRGNMPHNIWNYFILHTITNYTLI